MPEWRWEKQRGRRCSAQLRLMVHRGRDMCYGQCRPLQLLFRGGARGNHRLVACHTLRRRHQPLYQKLTAVPPEGGTSQTRCQRRSCQCLLLQLLFRGGARGNHRLAACHSPSRRHQPLYRKLTAVPLGEARVKHDASDGAASACCFSCCSGVGLGSTTGWPRVIPRVGGVSRCTGN